MERPDVGSRFFQDLQKFRLYRGHRLVDLTLGDLQAGELGFIELFAVGKQGFVPVCPHICNNIRNNAFHIGGGLGPGKDLFCLYLGEFQNFDHKDASVCAASFF